MEWSGVVKHGLGVIKYGVTKHGVIKRGVITRGVIKRRVIKRGVIKHGIKNIITDNFLPMFYHSSPFPVLLCYFS